MRKAVPPRDSGKPGQTRLTFFFLSFPLLPRTLGRAVTPAQLAEARRRLHVHNAWSGAHLLRPDTLVVVPRFFLDARDAELPPAAQREWRAGWGSDSHATLSGAPNIVVPGGLSLPFLAFFLGGMGSFWR
jgi:hypothetical protein